jgi:hypothetical protein
VKRIFLAAVIATAACSNPGQPTGPAAPLSNTFESPEALARTVLEAFTARDTARLQSLALSEEEFRSHVWPELPTSRPERNVPFDYAWGQLKQRSDGSLHSTIGRYAGRKLTFVRTRFNGETTKYASFEIMRESEIIASDEDGRDLILRLYGSAMVKDGRYKLFSYVVDD